MRGLKKLVNNFKEYYSNNKERCLTILTIIILSILSSIILISYSFYQNKSSRLIISGVALIDSSDVSIKVYRENRNDDGVGIGRYSISYYIPNDDKFVYNSNKNECDIGITIEKYENQKFYVDATKKGKCKVYFDAIDGYTDDYEVNLFVQQELGNTDDKNYNQMGQLPLYEIGYYYTINKNKTRCNYLNASVDIIGRDVYVTSKEKTTCNVYVDKNSDNSVPIISDLIINDGSISATLSDNIFIVGYAITNEEIIPEDYVEISNNSYDLKVDNLSKGIYYLWVKDSANNIACSSFTIENSKTAYDIIITSNDVITNETSFYKDNLNNNIYDYRYEGEKPNNYICLDNKSEGTCTDNSLIFRIVGMFNESYSENGSNANDNLIKIISTVNYNGTAGVQWSSSNTNNWSSASLYSTLNNTFYNSLTTNNSINKNITFVNVKWHLGGANSSNYYNVTPSIMFTSERDTSSNSILSGNPTSVYAKVGIIYPSDYAYAVLSKDCNRTTKLYVGGYDTTSNCHTLNWLYNSASFVNSFEWLISPYANDTKYAACLNSTGYINHCTGNNYVNKYFAVRPTLYLKSNIKILNSSNGSKSNPFRIES